MLISRVVRQKGISGCLKCWILVWFYSTITRVHGVIISYTRFCPAFRELCNATAMEHMINWTIPKGSLPLVVGHMPDASLNKHWRMIPCLHVMPCLKYRNCTPLNEKQPKATLHMIKSRNSEKRNHTQFS